MQSVRRHVDLMFRQLVPTLVVLACCSSARAQLPPEIGYVYPPGGQPGTTFDVVLGGYDWTPDMQIFSHDPRIKIELAGPPSEVLVPEPPYWFGAKARGPAWPLPREFPARITISAEVPQGVVRWQVANANGASPAGFLHVGANPEFVEPAGVHVPRELPPLPVTVSGQIRKIEEIDRYRFRAERDGPISVALVARQLGSPLHAVIQVRDESGQRIVDRADTEGRDLAFTFGAKADDTYEISLHDADFAGDRSYIYRLSITPGPRIVAAYPAVIGRNRTETVEFVGYGLLRGGGVLESLRREVTSPGDDQPLWHPTLDTLHGPTAPFRLGLSAESDLCEPPGTEEMTLPRVPCAVTGAIESRFGSDVYLVAFGKDSKWRIEAQAESIGSRLDLDLSIVGPDGKDLAATDDTPGSTDPMLAFTAPSDGTFRVVVSDRSGHSGSRAAWYRLVIAPQTESFSATVPAQLNVPLDGKVKLTVQLIRAGGFRGPVELKISGLPPGVTLPTELVIPADKNELAIELTCAADAPVAASLVAVEATAMLDGVQHMRKIGNVLVATTMKPRIKITPEGLDDVRKVNRGSTFLAPLLLERLEGFGGEIVLEMTSKQQRHRQGLASPEFICPPGAKRVEYPIFVPEWMETTKTSRMILNGAVRVPDPRGNVRTLLQKMELRIGLLPEGALLKLTNQAGEISLQPGGTLVIPLQLARAPDFLSPVNVELLAGDWPPGLFSATPLALETAQADAEFIVRISPEYQPDAREYDLTLRATSTKDGWPVIAETTVTVRGAEAR